MADVKTQSGDAEELLKMLVELSPGSFPLIEAMLKVKKEEEMSKEVQIETEVIDSAWVDSVNEKLQALSGMEFMLTGPATLTVRKRDNSYSRKPHIGGENFILTSVYIGKRGTPLFCFKPVEAAEYAEVEMNEATARSKLAGFSEFADAEIFSYDVKQALTESAKQAALAAEREKNKSKYETYAEQGFGSW